MITEEYIGIYSNELIGDLYVTRKGKYLKAVSFFNKVIELYPEHPKVQSYLEDCEYELKTLM